jgi:tripartite-type tricarboxylate transporter receptor subunit TctC
MNFPARLAIVVTVALATFSASLGLSLPGSAASYPERNITLIVPVPPGGAGDFIGRLVADRLSDALGAKVVVEDRGGASGTIASSDVARSAADGYTLILSSSTTLATAPASFKTLPYDPLKDFTNIGLIATAPAVLSVNAALPAHSIADLVAYAKSHPDRLNYGSAGIGSPGHLWGEMFKEATGSPMIHVPYKGTGPAMTDLVSGQIQVLLDGLPSQISNIKVGTIRSLAAMSEARSPLLPDVPTMGEAGYPTVLGGLWFGLSGPAGMPQDIVDRISAGLAGLGKDEGFAAKLTSTGVLVTLLPPDGYSKFIESEISRYRKIAHDAAISVD